MKTASKPLPLPALAILLFVFSMAAPASALAQYMWVDAKGVKQLSDRPPPPDVPASRILKMPGKPVFNPAATPQAADTPQAVATPQAANPAAGRESTVPAVPDAKAPPTLTERNADFNQRQADAASAAKKAAVDAQRKADIAANCEQARQNQRALDQGIRIAKVDQNGERDIMDDKERTAFGKKNREVLVECR